MRKGDRKESKRAQYLKVIKKASKDFKLFAQIIGEIKIGKHQKRWVEVCQEISDNPFGGQQYVIIAAPGSGKSQMIAVLFTAFMIGRYPEEHWGLIVYADDPAKERALAVRDIIEHSEIYHQIFPNIIPNKKKWGTKSFRIERPKISDFHPTLRAAGATAAVVSYRMSGVIIDDPHDPKNSDTPAKREKVYLNWEQAIKTRILAGGFRLCITTRWADDDFAGTLLRKEEGWVPIHTPAITSKGQSYWPEKYPVEDLRKIERENPETFAIQYMGDTTKGSSGIFRELATYSGEIIQESIALKIKTGRLDLFNQTLRYIHPDKGELDLLIGVGIDTALKDKERNDFAVIYTGGLDRMGRVWILDRRKGRWTLPELTNEIEEVYMEYQPYSIWVEDAAAGTPAVQTLKASLPFMPLELQTPTVGGKRSRALSMQPYINNGDIIFPKDTDWFDDAEYFIMRIGSAGHDDDVDALFMLLKNILTVRHPSEYDVEGRLQGKIHFR